MPDAGTERWRFETDHWVSSSPTVADGTVFVGSWKKHLYAVDADSGAERWQFGDGWSRPSEPLMPSSPTVADGTVFVGSRDGNLYAVDADSGAERWRFGTDRWVRSSPTVADGTVFVGSNDGNLYAIHTGDDGASSHGSRVLLGTLGHHDTTVSTDPATVDATGADGVERSNPTKVYDPGGEGTVSDTGGGASALGSRDAFCPDCGTAVPENAAYCPGCGEELRRCPKCAATFPASPACCPACGADLDR
jgi:hypothetical protein